MKNDLWMLKYARDLLVFTAILFHVVCVVCVCVTCSDVLRPLVRISASEVLQARLSPCSAIWRKFRSFGKQQSVCYNSSLHALLF